MGNFNLPPDQRMYEQGKLAGQNELLTMLLSGAFEDYARKTTGDVPEAAHEPYMRADPTDGD